MNSNRAFKINVYRIVSKIFKYGMQEMTFVLGALPLLTATGKSRKFNNIKGKKKKKWILKCSALQENVLLIIWIVSSSSRMELAKTKVNS